MVAKDGNKPVDWTRRFGRSSALARAVVPELYRAWNVKNQTAPMELPANTDAEIRELADRLGLRELYLDHAAVIHSVRTYLALIAKLSAYFWMVRDSADRADIRLLEFDRSWFRRLESNELFDSMGLLEFLPKGTFDWYVDLWTRPLGRALAELAKSASSIDLVTEITRSDRPVDLFHALYVRLLPRTVRHHLGEYYTPIWLAEYVMNQTWNHDSTDRLIDPACGSGLFLTVAIRRLRASCELRGKDAAETLGCCLNQVVGADLNPVAVLVARTNYLMALGDLVHHGVFHLQIPVHQCDSILHPIEERFDAVAGNPPWIGWESLSDEYRKDTLESWIRYGLFPHAGMEAILGSGKKDLSLLMSFAVTDKLLRKGGKLGFVITQSAFKTAGAAQGFRRFRFGTEPDECMHVDAVDDLSDLQPFDGASTKTAVVFWTKGKPTQYPIKPYRIWRQQAGRKVLSHSAMLEEILPNIQILADWQAEPVNESDPTSAWVTTRGVNDGIRRLLGASDYRAREGANSGGANAVYWLDVLSTSKGRLKVRNITAGAKRAADLVEAEVEPDLVYRLLRGGDISRWRGDPSAYVLLAQNPKTRRGFDEDELKQKWPLTYKYLKRFEKTLRERAAYKRFFTRKQRHAVAEAAPFYSMFNIGSYTLAEHKVVWHRMLSPIQAAVVGTFDGKPIIPQETLAFVACRSAEEAGYIAGLMNSLPFNRTAVAFSQVGGKSFGSPHLLEQIAIMQFDANNPVHAEVARHALSLQRNIDSLSDSERAELESRIDRLAAQVWGLQESELAELHKEMAILERPVI